MNGLELNSFESITHGCAISVQIYETDIFIFNKTTQNKKNKTFRWKKWSIFHPAMVYQ